MRAITQLGDVVGSIVDATDIVVMTFSQDRRQTAGSRRL
jgi:hypothetical protein